MRLVTQLGVVAVLAAIGGGAWFYRGQLMPSPSTSATAATGPAAAQRAVPVNVKPVRLGPIDDSIEAVGTALANESITVTAKTAGMVKAVRFTDGQSVKAGTVLLELDDRETLAELDAGKAAREQARVALERARALLGTGNAPQSRVDDLEGQFRSTDARARMSESRLNDLRIVAPFSGKLGLRRVSVGTLISPGTVITSLDDIDTIKLSFAVPETALAKVKPGSAVAASASAYPGQPFKGTVTVVDSRVDPVSRSSEVRAEIPNLEGALKPGMFLTVQLTLGRRENAMLVPEECLVPEGTRQYVYVVADGKAVKTEVKIGLRRQGDVEIVGGLKNTDSVVTAGVQKIRDGTPVRAVEGLGG
ncbi:MAG: efflux RND transporter periplasmic adaptor subunit [Proteobacteria bacterium]|nr:efflux RND transporter periplasmic adaptor subunit [Pseudomonadota bacterium]MBI3495705.1 efflux RND transporter periplasmic adaptor subunit [Pseudomonadota bacterium]